MTRTKTVELGTNGVAELQKWLDDYKKWIDQKTQQFVDALAERGCHIAQIHFSSATYDGDNDVAVKVEKRGDNAAAVIATGKATLFIEFGAGYMLGFGHPEPQSFGPGTYPGKGHWDDPGGWYLPKSVQEATGQKKSFGNPPAAPMYVAVKDLEMELERIAREVFA